MKEEKKQSELDEQYQQEVEDAKKDEQFQQEAALARARLEKTMEEESTLASRGESTENLWMTTEQMLKLYLSMNYITRLEAEEYRHKYAQMYIEKFGEVFREQNRKKRAMVESMLGVTFETDAEYNAVDKALIDGMDCIQCDKYCHASCGKVPEKKRYLRPKVVVENGKAIVIEERCSRWEPYVDMQCARAGIPRRYQGKGFSDYALDKDNADAVDLAKWYVKEYPKSGLYIYGAAGVGKTFLASIIARELIKAGHKVIFGDVPSLLKEMKKRFDSRDDDDNLTAQAIQDRYINAEVLVLDDIGAGYITPWNVGVLYEIINERYNLWKRTIVTSNYDIDDLGGRLDVKDAEYESERIVSRLYEMCEIEQITGADRRKMRRVR